VAGYTLEPAMNPYQDLLDTQQAFFASGGSKSAAWRLDQLDRMARLLQDNQAALCDALYQDFHKPPFEQQFEISVPLGVIDY
jgi:aldehyde dehydrogenase (NAD+)